MSRICLKLSEVIEHLAAVLKVPASVLKLFNVDYDGKLPDNLTLAKLNLDKKNPVVHFLRVRWLAGVPADPPSGPY